MKLAEKLRQYIYLCTPAHPPHFKVVMAAEEPTPIPHANPMTSLEGGVQDSEWVCLPHLVLRLD